MPFDRSVWRRAWFHLAALCVTFVFAAPAFWAIIASFHPPGAPLPSAFAQLPDSFEWSNYLRLFDLLPFERYLLNSMIVAAVAVPLTVIIASWAGFAMAQLPEGMRNALLAGAIIVRMTPVTALWLTRFLVLNELRLIDTYAALLAPVWMGSSPLFVLIFYWSFRRVPTEVIESARLDGLGAFAIWARIAMPLARPATGAVGVLTFVQYWSDFINPLLYLKSESRYTLPVGLRILQQMDLTSWSLLLAGAAIMTAPVMVLFIVAQRAFWIEAQGWGGDRKKA
ncbi:carbohydrate ABC transporter permease [Roseiflexus sp.]|uniref:carbohydrate ABC transporter permease n=1 Tax=Roseiflexus sp. TaxID=2562120 RepID=UPI00398A629C